MSLSRQEAETFAALLNAAVITDWTCDHCGGAVDPETQEVIKFLPDRRDLTRVRLYHRGCFEDAGYRRDSREHTLSS